MKQGSFKVLSFAVCLILMAGIAVPTVFGDEFAVRYESILLEDFSSGTVREWTVGSRTFTYDFTWELAASRFASYVDGVQYPRMAFADAFPMALYGLNRDGREIRSLGINGRFDRRGYNWIDVYPVSTETGEPFEIPIPGRVSYIDTWVWGSNLNYYMEVYLRDHNGIVHNLHLGSIGHQGWKSLRVQIPTNIRQARRTVPRFTGLDLVKFRIWTTPTERVDNFYIYIDHIKVLTDTFETLFDGDELADPDRVQEIWASAN